MEQNNKVSICNELNDITNKVNKLCSYLFKEGDL